MAEMKVVAPEAVPQGSNRHRVFRKASYDDHIMVYMAKREFIDHGTHVDPIDAVVLPCADFEKLDSKIFAHLACILRYGNDDWDSLGVPYEKMLYSKTMQVFPPDRPVEKLTSFHRKMMRKLGDRAIPIMMVLPTGLPSSVFLQAVGTEKPKKPERACGISLQLIVNFAEKEEEPANKKKMVRFVFRKLSFIPPPEKPVQPSVSTMNKHLLGSPTKVDLSLDKDTYYPGDTVLISLDVTNFGREIKKVRAQIEQNVELKIDDGPKNWTSRCVIARVKTAEGCPIEKGKSQSMKLTLPVELPTSTKQPSTRLVAVDGWIRGEDLRLAASTRKTHTARDQSIGLAVSYCVTVKCKRLGGNVAVNIPFVLSGAPPKAKPKTIAAPSGSAAAASPASGMPEMKEIPPHERASASADVRRPSQMLHDEPEDSDDDLIDFGGDSDTEDLSKEFAEFVATRAKVEPQLA
eukprot:Opistho-2@21929